MYRFNIGLAFFVVAASCVGLLWLLFNGGWSRPGGTASIGMFGATWFFSVVFGLTLMRFQAVAMGYVWVLVAYALCVPLAAIFGGALGLIPYVMDVERVSLMGALGYVWISAALTGLPLLGIAAFTFHGMARRRRAETAGVSVDGV